MRTPVLHAVRNRDFILKVQCAYLASTIMSLQVKGIQSVQWNLDLVTDLVIQKSVTKSWVVTKSMYFMY